MAFLYSHWLELSLTTRIIIAKAFGISKTGSTHVQDNRIVSDGFNIKDVENALTDDRIREYVGVEKSTGDSPTLWRMMVDKAEGRVPVEEPIPFVAETAHVAVIAEPKKRGRKPKQVIK